MMRLSLVLLILHSLCAVAQDASIAMPNCRPKCGNIEVPYPFGIGAKCSAGSNYTVVCNGSAGHEKLFLPALNLQADKILLQPQTVRVLYTISPIICSEKQLTDQLIKLPGTHPYNLSSTYSRFVVVGCNNVASMIPSYGACNPICRDDARGCNGINCCEAKIPLGLKELNLTYHTVNPACRTGSGEMKDGDACGYAFLTDDKWVKSQATRNFSDVSNPFNKQVGLVLHWEFDTSEVRTYPHVKCNDTTTENITTTVCFCENGFEGNPHLPGGKGCQDIDECKDPKKCINGSTCVNKEGSYTCEEPIGKKLAIYAGASGLGALLLLVGGGTSTMVVKKRIQVHRKTYFFNRNGGLLLQKQLPANDTGGNKFRIFNSEELYLATSHYKENLKLGSGGQGSVYQGHLDKKIVAVKKEADEAKKVDERRIEAFITEVVILSQIDHKNIVKLLGCCLETEVPILVYEFIPNGTLFDYIHGGAQGFPWESRLKMATEIAEAIAELHDAKPLPIYHRDVKSTNILLDDAYQPKVSDFGLPWSVSIDQSNQPTRLMKSGGYADPSYLQSSHYTDKSDVYSFGVVMVELLTGHKAVSDVKYEEGEKVLAKRFQEAIERNNLSDIIHQEVQNGPKEEIMAFAELARRCLDLDDKKRPTMKEATEELVRIKNPKEGSKSQSTEIEAVEASDVSDYPSSSTTPNLNVLTGEPQ